MNRVESAKVAGHYLIDLSFSDGTQGRVDLSEHAGKGVFKAWADPQIFAAVRVEDGALLWPGGIDLCADSLLLRMTGKQPEDLFPALSRLVSA